MRSLKVAVSMAVWRIEIDRCSISLLGELAFPAVMEHSMARHSVRKKSMLAILCCCNRMALNIANKLIDPIASMIKRIITTVAA